MANDLPAGASIITNAPDAALKIEGLTKIYRGRSGAPDKHALKGIDLEVKTGSLFALLGPNGAGKSTMINILAGLVTKTAGSARIWHYDIDRETRRARAAIGIVPQELTLDAFFSPRHMLELYAGMYGVPPEDRRTMEILEAVGLADKADVYSRTLSGGMRRRLMVAKAMVHRPPILILDEPTAGVDVELRQQLWAYVRDLYRAGTTVLLTTHYLEEAEALCDTIAIINHGQVIACEDKSTMLRRIDKKALTVTCADDLPDTLEGLQGIEVERLDDRRCRLMYTPREISTGEVIACIQQSGVTISDLTTEDPDLEDVFLTLTRSDNCKDASAA